MKTVKCSLLLTWLLLILQLNVFSESKDLDPKFVLEGRIDRDTGTIKLYPQSLPLCSPSDLREQTARIKNGCFSFFGAIAYPTSFVLVIHGEYISGTFFLEPGKQFIICHMDSLRVIPIILNKSMTEYRNKFLPGLDVLKSYVNDREIFKKKRIEYVVDYSQKYPHSYIAFWSIADELSKGRDPKLLYTAFEKLSASIRKGYSGKILEELLQGAKSITLGSLFPKIELLNNNNSMVTIPVMSADIKFTLVDFWFSNCGPCIEQFPDLKRLFSKYKQHGFNIIGISVDKKEKVSNWKRIILEQKLIWPQYLDMSQTKSEKLVITYFPTNFLLDSSGKIIAKDISMRELSAFIADNLK